AFDFRAVHYTGLHADKRLAFDHASMKQRHMPDRHIVADQSRITIQRRRFAGADGLRRRRYMNDRSILNIGALADADFIHIAAHDAAEPNGTSRTDFDIADNHRARGDESARIDLRHDAVEGKDNGGWRRHLRFAAIVFVADPSPVRLV